MSNHKFVNDTLENYIIELFGDKLVSLEFVDDYIYLKLKRGKSIIAYSFPQNRNTIDSIDNLVDTMHRINNPIPSEETAYKTIREIKQKVENRRRKGL